MVNQYHFLHSFVYHCWVSLSRVFIVLYVIVTFTGLPSQLISLGNPQQLVAQRKKTSNPPEKQPLKNQEDANKTNDKDINIRIPLTQKPIASIVLYKTEFLTEKIFKDRIKNFQNLRAGKFQTNELIMVRDRIIDSMIIAQAAEKAKIKAKEEEIFQYLRERLSKPNASQEEIKAVYEASDLAKNQSWKEFLQVLINDNILQNYLKSKVSMDSINPPTDEEIRKFYFENKNDYFIPTKIRVSHIFLSFENLQLSEREAVKKKSEKVLGELNSGKYSFEELVKMYSEHKESAERLGDLFYIFDTPEFRQFLGDEFVTTATKLRSGQTSGVITGQNGYHIIKVTEKENKKELSLSDADPNNPRSTVYQYVERQLINIAYDKKVMEFINNLRSQTKITINEDVWNLLVNSKL